jgi:hypothetical protein
VSQVLLNIGYSAFQPGLQAVSMHFSNCTKMSHFLKLVKLKNRAFARILQLIGLKCVEMAISRQVKPHADTVSLSNHGVSWETVKIRIASSVFYAFFTPFLRLFYGILGKNSMKSSACFRRLRRARPDALAHSGNQRLHGPPCCH